MPSWKQSSSTCSTRSCDFKMCDIWYRYKKHVENVELIEMDHKHYKNPIHIAVFVKIYVVVSTTLIGSFKVMAWIRQRLKSSSVTSGCFMTKPRIISWASVLPSRAIISINRFRSSEQIVSFSSQTRLRAFLPKTTKSFRSKEWTNLRSWCTHSVLFRSSGQY